MTGDVEIRVRDLQTGAVLFPMRAMRLPVTVGRSGAEHRAEIRSGDDVVEVFATGLDRLSRKHLSIRARAEGMVEAEDKSSNGTSRVAGDGSSTPMTKGLPESLAEGSTTLFKTVDLEIAVTVPQMVSVQATDEPLHMVFESQSRGGLRSVDFEGASIAFLEKDGDLEMKRRPGTAAEAMVKLVNAGAACKLVVGASPTGGLMVSVGNADGVRHNRQPLKDGETKPLAHLDTLEVQGQDLRFLSAEEGKGITCTNPACRQLNPYLPDDNCIYCGQKLIGGVTFFVAVNT